MTLRSGSRSFGSAHYLAAIVLATLVMSGVALYIRNAGLSLAAAILGLYLLHLLSIRFILEAQRRQQAALREQFELLHELLGTGNQPEGDRPATSEPEPPRGGEGDTPSGGLGPRGLQAWIAREAVIATAAEDLAVVGGAAGDAAEAAGTEGRPPEVPIPRHFALGTVALIRGLLNPSQVARVLLEQERQPDRRFGELAVDLDLITTSQLEELLLDQQEGLFTDAEIRKARKRLEEFRGSPSHGKRLVS